jgi:RNA polymerase sigma factor (sigma-70 family)
MPPTSLSAVVRQVHKLTAPGDNAAASDAHLLDRFSASGDEAAFATLVRRHGPLVMGVCRRVLRHHQDAEDAFQATFLVLARNAAAIRRRTALASWLYGVARRVAADARRAAARRQARERRATNMGHAQADLDAAWRKLQAVLAQEVLPGRHLVNNPKNDVPQFVEAIRDNAQGGSNQVEVIGNSGHHELMSLGAHGQHGTRSGTHHGLGNAPHEDMAQASPTMCGEYDQVDVLLARVLDDLHFRRSLYYGLDHRSTFRPLRIEDTGQPLFRSSPRSENQWFLDCGRAQARYYGTRCCGINGSAREADADGRTW